MWLYIEVESILDVGSFQQFSVVYIDFTRLSCIHILLVMKL